MICAPCGEHIVPGSKYFAVFKMPNGLRIEIGCEHFTPTGEGLVATLGSFDCLNQWMQWWESGLMEAQCDHRRSAVQ